MEKRLKIKSGDSVKVLSGGSRGKTGSVLSVDRKKDRVVIEGVNIEREISDACDDYGNQNWVGFGYNVVRLVKTLLA